MKDPDPKVEKLVEAAQKLVNLIDAFGGVEKGDMAYSEYVNLKVALGPFRRQKLKVVTGGKPKDPNR